MISTLVSWFGGDLLTYVVAGLAAIAGIFGYGWTQKRAGRKEVVDEIDRADKEGALEIRRKLDEVSSDGDALERLRKRGRLRD